MKMFVIYSSNPKHADYIYYVGTYNQAINYMYKLNTNYDSVKEIEWR